MRITPLNAQIATKLLEKKGVIIEHAENGKIALEMFQKCLPNYYDAILMDIRMPVMDGLKATKEIRSMERNDVKKIPIIAMTANSFDEDVRQCMEAGMNNHLSKPFEPQKLYKTLVDAFGKDKD
ncbi:MAG: response regulator [Oscillospiraceae bacterium]